MDNRLQYGLGSPDIGFLLPMAENINRFDTKALAPIEKKENTYEVHVHESEFTDSYCFIYSYFRLIPLMQKHSCLNRKKKCHRHTRDHFRQLKIADCLSCKLSAFKIWTF